LRDDGLARHDGRRRQLGGLRRNVARRSVGPPLTSQKQADLAALDLAYHLVAHDDHIGGEEPVVLLVDQPHLRAVDLGEDANAAEALHRICQGTDSAAVALSRTIRP
jgi:hypothetical protein